MSRALPDEAAKESNLPSVGLPRPAGFEDQMGHQTPAAPWLRVTPPLCRAPTEHAESSPPRPRELPVIQTPALAAAPGMGGKELPVIQ
jgi:hypothetical protein